MKKVLFNTKAREALKRGVDLIADAVKITLGPRGRNVVYGFPYGFPISTKDGVTVARQVETANQEEQLGVLLVRQVAQKTADDSGDGTTTAAVLSQAIFNEGLKAVGTGVNPILLKRGIDKAVADVVKWLKANTIKIENKEIHKVAALSANNDADIGLTISQAIKDVGENGVITIEDNYYDSSTVIDIIEGMELNEGVFSPFFFTDNAKQEASYEDPCILLIDDRVTELNSMKAIIQKVIAEEKRPLVIICHDISHMPLQMLLMNRAQHGLPICACKASQRGKFRTDQFADIAALTGGIVFSSASIKQLKDAQVSDLGTCRKLMATKDSTTIIEGGGAKEDVGVRIKQIEDEIKKAYSDYDKEKLQERYAKLTTGVAVIKCGAGSEVEQKEKKMRIEDALMATRAALDGGIIAGGGIAYLNASRNALDYAHLTKEAEIGVDIVKKALEAPIRQIATNSGLDGSDIIAQIKTTQRDKGLEEYENSHGYNFLTNQYGNLVDMGVIDPTKVVINALENAASVASMLLTTEVSICEEDDLNELIPKTPKPRSE